MNSTTKATAKKIFFLTRLEFLWVIAIIMLGIVMYWSAVIIEPIKEINVRQEVLIRAQEVLIRAGISQNDRIIGHQDNNTALLVELFNRQNTLLTNQISLVSEISNATSEIRNLTKGLESYGIRIEDSLETITGQSDEIARMIGYFRNVIDENYTKAVELEQQQINQTLANVTENNERIELLMQQLLLNKQNNTVS